MAGIAFVNVESEPVEEQRECSGEGDPLGTASLSTKGNASLID